VFGPGITSRAMTPAMNPITMTQRKMPPANQPLRSQE
jgi:hypothetical protein